MSGRVQLSAPLYCWIRQSPNATGSKSLHDLLILRLSIVARQEEASIQLQDMPETVVLDTPLDSQRCNRAASRPLPCVGGGGQAVGYEKLWGRQATSKVVKIRRQVLYRNGLNVAYPSPVRLWEAVVVVNTGPVGDNNGGQGAVCPVSIHLIKGNLGNLSWIVYPIRAASQFAIQLWSGCGYVGHALGDMLWVTGSGLHGPGLRIHEAQQDLLIATRLHLEVVFVR